MAAIYSLYIINKSGGLIFYKDCGTKGRMDTNDSLRVASLWHSMDAISQQLSPVNGWTTKAAHMLALPKVADFFARLIQRVAPKSYQQAAWTPSDE